MISRSFILQILQAAKIMRRFFYEAPAEIMRIYTTPTSLSLSLSFSLTHKHTLIHSHSFYHTHCLAFTLSTTHNLSILTFSHSLKYTHTLSLSYTHTHIDGKTRNVAFSFVAYMSRFHQHFMGSFYTQRSQNHKNSVKLSVSFCTFGICERKSFA